LRETGWRRLAIAELAQGAKLNAAHLSRIEHGHWPPTARIAAALDGVFTERRGWYLTWLEETRTAPEIPVTFRSWSDYEDRTATLRAWTPGWNWQLGEPAGSGERHHRSAAVAAMSPRMTRPVAIKPRWPGRTPPGGTGSSCPVARLT